MKCPGQDMQYWREGAIFEVACPQCGKTVEFYKDDTSRICHNCGKRFVNPKKDFGCASYCQYAEQCLGTLPEEFVGQQENLLKDKVAVEVKRLYKADFKRIGHVTRVARHAENIGKIEGGNLAVILCAAYLQDIGQVSLAHHQQAMTPENLRTESAKTAVALLSQLKAKEIIQQNVCAILEEASGVNQTIEFKILSDAILIAGLEENQKEKRLDLDGTAMAETIAARALTEGGRKIAMAILIG
jgi:HD superfamily phosphodiesterase